MEKCLIGRESVTLYGKKKGSNRNKFNRVAKLGYMYNDLYLKFRGMADRGFASCTETSRCAVAVLLLMETGIRIGNESSAEGYYTVPHLYAKDKQSRFVQTYGLTTLKREHVRVRKGDVMFKFVGKKQVDNVFRVPSELRKYVLSLLTCKQEPVFGINDYVLTKFIKKYVGKQFTPKDFRTLRANVIAGRELKAMESVIYLKNCNKRTKKEVIKTVCEKVSEQLNNTAAVCKRSYIDDMLWEQEIGI